MRIYLGSGEKILRNSCQIKEEKGKENHFLLLIWFIMNKNNILTVKFENL